MPTTPLLLSHLAERLSLRFPLYAQGQQDALSDPLAVQARLPHFCVALSGGRDSVALLAALQELCPGQVSACHVHHGLSPNADAWASFCVQLGARWQIPVKVYRVDVPRTTGKGIEAAARQARYAAFQQFAEEYHKKSQNPAPELVFCLAQHREDQAETVLLKLLRGSGVKGAAGMWEWRRWQGQRIWREMQISLSDGLSLWRPLLTLPRRALEDYLTARQLSWIEDESNQDQHYRRNFLRQAVFPQLESHFPAAAANLARAAQHFQDAESILQEVAAADYAAMFRRYGLPCAALLALSPARQHNLLRYVLEQAGEAMPEQEALRELLRQVRKVGAEGSDQAMRFPLQGHSWQIAAGELCLVPHTPPPPREKVFWQGEPAIAWAGGVVRFELRQGQGLSLRRLANLGHTKLYLRTRQGGERLKLAANRPSQRLKQHWQAQGLPPWQRERWPLLFAELAETGEEKQPILLWCPEFGLHYAWQAQTDEMGYFPIWSENQ